MTLHNTSFEAPTVTTPEASYDTPTLQSLGGLGIIGETRGTLTSGITDNNGGYHAMFRDPAEAAAILPQPVNVTQ